MATLNGYANGVQYVQSPSANPVAVPGSDPSLNTVVIDGTPIRVVILCVAAAAGLTALRLGGIRFNVGVSS